MANNVGTSRSDQPRVTDKGLRDMSAPASVQYRNTSIRNLAKSQYKRPGRKIGR